MLLDRSGEEDLLQGLLKSPRVLRIEVVAVGGEDCPDRFFTSWGSSIFYYCRCVAFALALDRAIPNEQMVKKTCSPHVTEGLPSP